jgi:uncharacterized protein (TIGR02594 family)
MIPAFPAALRGIPRSEQGIMSETLRTTASSLNVRAGAGTTFPVLAKLPQGTTVKRLEASPAGDWFRIHSDAGLTGWIAARFAVTDASLAPAPAAAEYRVTATTLNLRAEPTTASEVVKQLPNGAVVSKLETSSDQGWLRVRTSAGTEGWVSAKWLTENVGTDPDAPRPNDPPWYAIAWGERGVKEIAGPAANPRIIEYQAATNYRPGSDEVHWCSSFVNWVMKEAGIARTNSAAARSWLKWGKKIAQPVRGCVVVLRRGNNPQNGHVAFYVSRQGDLVRLLGGNQGDQVKISRYKAADVLSYHMPTD